MESLKILLFYLFTITTFGQEKPNNEAPMATASVVSTRDDAEATTPDRRYARISGLNIFPRVIWHFKQRLHGKWLELKRNAASVCSSSQEAQSKSCERH